jgi:hypothetical protein
MVGKRKRNRKLMRNNPPPQSDNCNNDENIPHPILSVLADSRKHCQRWLAVISDGKWAATGADNFFVDG